MSLQEKELYICKTHVLICIVTVITHENEAITLNIPGYDTLQKQILNVIGNVKSQWIGCSISYCKFKFE